MPLSEQDFLSTLEPHQSAVANAPLSDEEQFLSSLDTVETRFKEDLALSQTPIPELNAPIEDAEKVVRGITNAAYMKEVLGVHYRPSSAMGAEKYVDEKIKDGLQKTYDLTTQHYNYAVRQGELDDLYYQIAEARENGKSTIDLEKRLSSIPAMEAPGKPEYPHEKAAAFTAGQIPVWADIIKSGTETGLALGMLGGAGAAAATGGIGAPEGFGLFYAAGQIYGSGKRIWQMMEGNSYREMLEVGIEEPVARKIARYGVGPVSVALNVLSFGAFKKLAPVGLRKLLGSVQKKTTKGIIGKASTLVKAIGTEVITESLEETNQIILNELGINLTNEINKAKGKGEIKGITREEFVTRVTDVAEATFYSMAVLGGTTSTIAYAVDKKYSGLDAKKEAKENIIDMTGYMVDKTTPEIREEARTAGAIILGVKEDEEGNVEELLMADRKTGEIFETGPEPTAEEIYTKTGVVPQIEIDVDKIIETGDIEGALKVSEEKARPQPVVSSEELQAKSDIMAELEFERTQDNQFRVDMLTEELAAVERGEKKAADVELWRNIVAEEPVVGAEGETSPVVIGQVSKESLLESKEADKLKVERARTFEPSEISQEELPADISGEFPPQGGGKYFHVTDKSLQEWLDSKGDGFLYRVTIPQAFEGGFDVGDPKYTHSFPQGKKKVHSFTSSLENAKNLIKEKGKDAIVYRVLPEDIDAEYTVQVHDGPGGIIHAHSPKPVHQADTIVLYANGQWEESADQVAEHRRLGEERRNIRRGDESALAGRREGVRGAAERIEPVEIEEELRKKLDIPESAKTAEEARPPAEIIKELNDKLGEEGSLGKGFNPQEVNPLITELAQSSWANGVRKLSEFSAIIKSGVGKRWVAIKGISKKIWGFIAELNKRIGEVGAIGLDITRPSIRPDTIKKIRTLAEQTRAAKASGDTKTASKLRAQLTDLIGKAKTEATSAYLSTLTEREKIKRRREVISNIRDYFGLTDNDLKTISKQDVRLMSDYQFKKFKDNIQLKAVGLSETRQAKLELIHTIHTMNLEKVDNYREALSLPPIKEMNINQLRRFDELLSEYQEGDSFLNRRQLETVDRTFLEGIRTWREAKEKLAEESGVPVEELNKIKTGLADSWRWDNALYEANPFYRVLVTRVNSSLLDAELKAHQIENEVFDLATKAQKSIKRTLIERAIPGDQQIFDYLEARNIDKESLAGQMTPEQLDLAHYMQEYFSQALTYLLETKSLNRGRENYFVHMRRTLLESIKEEGLIKGTKELFKNYELDEQGFNILDDSTGNILPLEKFFQFSLRRTGELVPTKNIVRAFTSYVNTFEKKVALDGIIPAMSIYAQSLTPTVYTPKGLEIDQSIKKFVNKYINSKKGRHISFDSVVKQGGPLDLALSSTRMFVSMLKLGFSPIAQLAAPMGEQAANLVLMGVNGQAKGTKRMLTDKGKRIIAKYEGFVGRSLVETLTAPGLQATDRLSSVMFAGFHAGSRIANSQYLLGMMSDAEYDSEEISTKRLAELKLESGRFRAVPGAESLIGATSAGKIGTQFKSWAIPVIRTTIKDLTTLAKDLRKKPFGEALSTKESAELLRMTALTATVLAITAAYQADDDDDSVVNKMVNRVLSEASLIYSAFDLRWVLFTTPPAIKWAQDLGMILADWVQLVEYKDGSGLRGPKRLVQHFTPGFIKSFGKRKKPKTKY